MSRKDKYTYNPSDFECDCGNVATRGQHSNWSCDRCFVANNMARDIVDYAIFKQEINKLPLEEAVKKEEQRHYYRITDKKQYYKLLI